MRKFLLLIFAVIFCGSAYSQKGRSAIGVNASVHGIVSYHDKLYYDVGVFTGLKYQYGFSDALRGEANFGIDAASGKLYSGGLTLHTFFSKNGRVRPYLVTGVSFDNTYDPEKYYDYYDYGNYYWEDDYKLAFGARAGIGLNVRLTYHWDMQIEGGYQSNFGEFAALGLTYNF